MRDYDLTPLLDAQQNQLSLEVSGGDAIDAKALGLLASNIALLIFSAQSALHLSPGKIILIVLFGISSVLDFIAIWPRQYSGASVSAVDHPEYLEYDSQTLVRQLISDTEIAIAANKQLNKKRLRFCTASLFITIAASILLLILL